MSKHIYSISLAGNYNCFLQGQRETLFVLIMNLKASCIAAIAAFRRLYFIQQAPPSTQEQMETESELLQSYQFRRKTMHEVVFFK